MKTNRSISLSVGFFLVFALALLIIPKESHSGMAFSLGCCIADNECLGCGELGEDCAVTQGTCLLDLGGTFFEGSSFCSEGLPGANCFAAGGTPGCCITGPGLCQDDVIISSCGGDQWFLDTACSEVSVCSESPNRNIPTLSKWGLISIALILGIAGFIVIRRRQATA